MNVTPLRPDMVMDRDEWAADPMTGAVLVRPCARLDVPTISRRSLRDAGAVLHQLANQLERLSLNPPGETLKDQTALMLAQSAVQGANKTFRQMKADDVAEIKRAKVKFGVERKAG